MIPITTLPAVGSRAALAGPTPIYQLAENHLAQLPTLFINAIQGLQSQAMGFMSSEQLSLLIRTFDTALKDPALRAAFLENILSDDTTIRTAQKRLLSQLNAAERLLPRPLRAELARFKNTSLNSPAAQSLKATLNAMTVGADVLQNKLTGEVTRSVEQLSHAITVATNLPRTAVVSRVERYFPSAQVSFPDYQTILAKIGSGVTLPVNVAVQRHAPISPRLSELIIQKPGVVSCKGKPRPAGGYQRRTPFTPQQGIDALTRAVTFLGPVLGPTVERMYRHETSHFKSLQFVQTGSPGMEVGSWGTSFPKDAPFYWGCDPQFGWRRFIMWNDPYEAMLFLGEYIKRHNGRWPRWNTTTVLGAHSQKSYTDLVRGVIPRISAALFGSHPLFVSKAYDARDTNGVGQIPIT